MYPWKYLFGLSRYNQGAWYDPSLNDDIQDGLKLLELSAKDRVVDLGSGDGRVVAAITKTTSQAVGIEWDEKLIKKARRNYPDLTFIHSSFWEVDLAPYNKVFVYQFKNVMDRLAVKLESELRPGSIVVSNYWSFPHWKVDKQIRYSRRYVV